MTNRLRTVFLFFILFFVISPVQASSSPAHDSARRFALFERAKEQIHETSHHYNGFGELPALDASALRKGSSLLRDGIRWINKNGIKALTLLALAQANLVEGQIGSPFQIGSNTSAHSWESIAVRPDGNVFVVYDSVTPVPNSTYVLSTDYVRVVGQDGPIGNEQVVNVSTTNCGKDVASFGDNTALIVAGCFGHPVLGSLRDASGTALSSPFTICSNSYQCGASGNVGLQNGNVLVSMHGLATLGKIFDKNGIGQTSLVTLDNTASYPTFCEATNGNIFLGLVTQQSTTKLRFFLYDPSLVLKSSNTNYAIPLSAPNQMACVALANDTIMALWPQSQGSNQQFAAAIFDGTNLSLKATVQNLPTVLMGFQSFSLASFNNGTKALLVYTPTQTPGAPNDPPPLTSISGLIIDSNGTILVQPFTIWAGYAQEVIAAGLPNGNIFIAWDANAQLYGQTLTADYLQSLPSSSNPALTSSTGASQYTSSSASLSLSSNSQSLSSSGRANSSANAASVGSSMSAQVPLLSLLLAKLLLSIGVI